MEGRRSRGRPAETPYRAEHRGRVWLGIHFRFGDTAARDMGVRLADWSLDHYFQPVDEHEER